MGHCLPAPAEGSRDPLRRMRVYLLADELMPDAWDDAKTLALEPLMQETARQLYASVGSIAANISEGYSRSSGRDRARLFEIALGSVRDSTSWYRAAAPVLSSIVVADRLNRLEEMRRMLLAIIPRERGRVMKKAGET
jgi:four helix bundle protein